jgi:hypothetical protein
MYGKDVLISNVKIPAYGRQANPNECQISKLLTFEFWNSFEI